MPEQRNARIRAAYPEGWVYQPPDGVPLLMRTLSETATHGGTWEARYLEARGLLSKAEADAQVHALRLARKASLRSREPHATA